MVRKINCQKNKMLLKLIKKIYVFFYRYQNVLITVDLFQQHFHVFSTFLSIHFRGTSSFHFCGTWSVHPFHRHFLYIGVRFSKINIGIKIIEKHKINKVQETCYKRNMCNYTSKLIFLLHTKRKAAKGINNKIMQLMDTSQLKFITEKKLPKLIVEKNDFVMLLQPVWMVES